MFRHRSRGVFAPLALALSLAPLGTAPAAAQEREVVFHQVSVSSREATLRLEFNDGPELVISLQEGELRVGDRSVGQIEPGGALDASWRALLAEAIALDNGAVSRLLASWTAPEGLSGESAAAAELLQSELASTFAGPPPALSPRPALEGLLLRQDRLLGLAAALQGLSQEGLRIEVGESVVISSDEVVPGSLVIVDGSTQLEGRVRGDLILLGGSVTFGDDARVDGNVRWSDARIEGNRDAVRGEFMEVGTSAALRDTEANLRDELRREIEASLRPEIQALRNESRSRSPSVFRNVTRGVSGLFQTLLTFGILLGTGLGLLYFFPRNVDVVARTARHATGRSALVGFATFVLGVPVWILGMLVLVVSIIGIPVALLWIPAFPLAVVLAMVAGYLAVAQNLGRWASLRQFGPFQSADVSRPAMRLGIGLMVLLSGFAAAHLLQIFGGIFMPFRVILNAAAGVLGVLTVAVGLGAMILSRGGRDPAFAGPSWDNDFDDAPASWSQDVDTDPLDEEAL